MKRNWKNMKGTLARLGVLIVGGLILGIGNTICINSGLGADPINVFYVGLAGTLGITLGMASNLIALAMIVVTALLQKEQLGIGTLVAPFAVKVGIDYIVPGFGPLMFPLNYVVMLAGLVLIAFGSALCIRADIGKNSYDALILSICHCWKVSYVPVRWGIDAVMLVTGICMGGKLTPGTIIAILVLGKMIEFFRLTEKE